jgi:predicted ribosome quality control (RQC) complex YloA/Tae2 family protein
MTPVSAVEIEQFQKMGDRLLSAFSAREILPNPLDYPLQHKISLTDYETQEEIVIEFDPLLSWVENAQRYYRKAKKAKSQQLIAETFKKKLETELAYLQELQVLLDQTETIEDLKALENDFVHAGLLNGEGFKKSEQQKASKVSGILELCSSEGFPILVGKTGTANELIVGKLAKPHDLWIHVHEMPGSHVLVRTEKREVPNQTLWEAANLAVHYSSARHGKNIPIIYTQGRYVRKIPDSYPGHVTYQHEKSAFITPDEGLLKQLHQGFIQS